MNDTTRAAILDEIREYNASQELQPGDFTITDYQDRHGLSRQVATKEIERAVQAGIVVDLDLKRAGNGKWVRAFRMAEVEDD